MENFKAIEVEVNDQIELLFDLDGNFIAEENDSSRMVSPDSIPQSIAEYTNHIFPDVPFDEVKLKSEYEVVFFKVELSNGAEFLFDEQGILLCQVEMAEAEIDGNDGGDTGDNKDDDDGNEDDD